VVIGADPFECDGLHTSVPKYSTAPANYKRSLLTGETMRVLHRAMLSDGAGGGGDNSDSNSPGAWTTATIIILDVLKLIVLGNETRELFMTDRKKPLGLLPETRHEATREQIAIRAAYSAAWHALHDKFKSIKKSLNGPSALDASHLEILGRALAWGYVSRSPYHYFRNYNDKSETGFIDRQALLNRLAMPDGVHLIDITRSSHSG
jgi:hypothetical protein